MLWPEMSSRRVPNMRSEEGLKCWIRPCSSVENMPSSTFSKMARTRASAPFRSCANPWNASASSPISSSRSIARAGTPPDTLAFRMDVVMSSNGAVSRVDAQAAPPRDTPMSSKASRAPSFRMRVTPVISWLCGTRIDMMR